MSLGRIAGLQASLLLLTVLASGSSEESIRIKVLDSETRSISLGGNDVPKNCDQANFDAYCNNSKAALLTNTMLVQEGDNPPFHIACTIDSKFSRCIPLPKGESFDAKREKHGMEVYYIDDKGKARRQFYTLIDTDAGGKAAPPVKAAVANQGTPSAVARDNSGVPAPATPSARRESAAVKEGKVKCNFSSTPSGAEITLDGKYVGNTPSEISVNTGTHAIIFSMPGFGQWKRDLSVTAGSELSVSAILQKQ